MSISGLSTAQNVAALSQPSPPSSPAVVMNVKECYSMLDSKFEAANGDILIFSGKKAVMSIGKLLVKYHENYNEHSLGTNDTFSHALEPQSI